MKWLSVLVPASPVVLPVVALLLVVPTGTELLGQTPPERTTSSFTVLTFPSADHSFVRVSLHVLGGAIVGGWAGYVGAQVAWSDWREGPGRRDQRVRFAVAGAAIGLVAGFVIGTHTPGVPRLMPPVSTLGQGAITEKEIRASTARSVSQLLRETRPQWVRSRGADVLKPKKEIRASTADSVSPLLMRPTHRPLVRSGGADVVRPTVDPLEAHGVRVYLNGELLGGLETLDEVSIHAVTRIEFLDSTAAMLRWGVGNDDGAILLTTRPSEW